MHRRVRTCVIVAGVIAALVSVVMGAGAASSGRLAAPARGDAFAPGNALAQANVLAASDALAPGGRVWLHAHNCYPELGAWRDRLDRALGTGLPWVAIEQDLAWAADPAAPGGGRSVVSHEAPPVGGEPTLEEHFFRRVLPLLDRALADREVERWPVLILHLDFKSNEPEHHRAVWELLGRYERYLTTSTRPADAARVEPLRLGPLLVLTESGEGQEDAFYTRQPVGGTLRVFGTVPPPELTEEERKRRHTYAPAALVRSGATAYRRWVNLAWDAVERGGPDEAGRWTAAEIARLRALVRRAHGLGLWIRFYALNGHPADASQGWSASYNFGSLAAARLRWRAALDAGVEFVATDQYEAFASELGSELGSGRNRNGGGRR